MRPFFVLLLGSSAVLAQSLTTYFGFEPNSGQFPEPVRFLWRSSHYPTYVTRDTLVLRNQVRLQIADLPENVHPEGDIAIDAPFHFYSGTSAPARRIPLYAAVRFPEIFPGVTAAFSTPTPDATPAPVNRMSLVVQLQPGAKLDPFRLRVLNTGTTPFDGPGGIWYVGGRITGVFAISLQASQLRNGVVTPIDARLRIEPDNSLSIQPLNLDPTLTARFEISFPSYDVGAAGRAPQKAEDGNTYAYGSVESPQDFGPDGVIATPGCAYSCADTVVVRLNDTGKPLWLTLLSGAASDYPAALHAPASGVMIAGSTDSADFPVTSNAPRPNRAGPQDAFLTLLDRTTGQILQSTYAGIDSTGSAGIAHSAVDPGGDVVVAGSTSDPSYTDLRGFLIRWRPSTNQIVFSARLDAPARALALDLQSQAHYATTTTGRLQLSILDRTGRAIGTPVTLTAPAAIYGDVKVLPLPNDETWVAYSLRPSDPARYYSVPPLWVARAAAKQGAIIASRQLARAGYIDKLALTPAGNLKALVTYPTPTETTFTNSALVAACPDTAYFAVLSPEAQLLHADYVPREFDLASVDEPGPQPPPPALACAAATAGRGPITFIVPGQLVTLTGGGFGPAAPLYSALDQAARYPVNLAGFRVRVAGFDAPIIAIARGLIAFQVPFEINATFGSVAIEVTDNGRSLNPLSVSVLPYQITSFDTGTLDPSTGLPVLAALNQDGTVNSPNNPALRGSVVSTFASGLGILAPPLATGALNPIPPDGPLSQTSLLNACWNCQVLYLGSAPGLSTSVAQINVKLNPEDSAPSGVHAYPLGVAVGSSPRSILIFQPTGVVYVQ